MFHTDTVTGLCNQPLPNYRLVNSYNNNLLCVHCITLSKNLCTHKFNPEALNSSPARRDRQQDLLLSSQKLKNY